MLTLKRTGVNPTDKLRQFKQGKLFFSFTNKFGDLKPFTTKGKYKLNGLVSDRITTSSSVNSTHNGWNRILIRLLTSSILTAIAILGGFAPELSWRTPSFLAISFSAYAQDVSTEEVIKYARASLEVELLRQQIYQRIKKITNEPPTNIACDRPDSYLHQPGEVRAIVVKYCHDSRQIVLNHSLSIARYNELKNNYDRGGDFFDRVQNALIEMQK